METFGIAEAHVCSDERPLLVALVARPGAAAGAKAAAELRALGCEVVGATSGRLYFYAVHDQGDRDQGEGPRDNDHPSAAAVCRAHLVERVGVVALRINLSAAIINNAVNCDAAAFVDPAAATKITAAAAALKLAAKGGGGAVETVEAWVAAALVGDVDWPVCLRAWASLVGRSATCGGTFRVDAKKSSKQGKADSLSKALEAALAAHFRTVAASHAATVEDNAAAGLGAWLPSRRPPQPTAAADDDGDDGHANAHADATCGPPRAAAEGSGGSGGGHGVDLEVSVRLGGSELLVFLPALVRPHGVSSRGYLASGGSGLHPSVCWALAHTVRRHRSAFGFEIPERGETLQNHETRNSRRS
jgi:plasmid stability protein